YTDYSEIRIWNEDGECVKTLETEIYPCCVTVWKTFLCTGHEDGAIRLWNPGETKCTLTLRGHTDDVCFLVADGDSLFSSSYDKTIRKWNIEGKCVAV